MLSDAIKYVDIAGIEMHKTMIKASVPPTIGEFVFVFHVVITFQFGCSFAININMEQKIKQVDGNIGENIRNLRLEAGLKQTELVGMLQLYGVNMTRETLVKIERGIHHLTVSQLHAIRDCLNTTYDELLK